MAVQKASDKLTQDKEGLIWAADPSTLMGQVNYLLLRFGQHIWDRGGADDLKYDILEDRVKISDLLREWIIVQALESFKFRKIRKLRTVSRRKAAKPAISQDLASEVEDVPGDEDDLDMELIDEVNTDHDALKDNDSKPEEQNTTRPVASKISVKAGDETESNEQDDATGKSKSRGPDVLPTLKTVAELDARFAANLAKASKTTASKTIIPKVKTREELDADFAANLARSVANTRSKRTEKHQPTYSADRTHEDVQNYVSTSEQPKSDQLTLSVYWDEAFWRRFVTEDVVTISKISASLGVRAQSARKMKDLATGQAQANDHPFIFKLEVETNRIASNLHAKLSTDELVKIAANSNSLVEEIDVLLANYASDIWGMDADRSKLLTPDRGRIYVKH
jgi:hypothetical protein